MIQLSYIKFLAKLGKKTPGITRIGKRLVSPEFMRATEFLSQNSLKPTQISGGIVVVSSVIFIFSVIILSTVISTLSAIVLGITIALLGGLMMVNSIISRFNQWLVQVEKQTPYVLEELATIYLTTNSMFEAIEYVSKGEYGMISSEFSKMISPLNRGVPPEQLLMRFATTQPSTTLRRGLLVFIQSSTISGSNLDAVITDAHENLQRRYERLTMQWESRMMVYSGLMVFLPIIVILGLAIRGLADNPLILLLPILQFGLSRLLLSTFLPDEMILLGE